MSALLARPGAPLQRLVTRLTVAALMLLGVWLAALTAGGHGPGLLPRGHEVALSAVAPAAAAVTPALVRRAAPQRVVMLVCGLAVIGLAGLLLALTQRGWTDMALAGAGFLWPMYVSLGARGIFGHAPAAPPWVLQALLLAAAWLSGWYALRLLQSPSAAARPPRLLKALVGVVAGVWALRALGRIDDFTAGWIVPLACLLGAASVLVRVVEAARRGGSVLRPAYGAWLVALAGAAAVGCGLFELWTRVVVESTAQGRAEAWLVTRWAVAALLLLLLGLRFEQLARMLGQLGRSHRSWRSRLRQSQRELHDVRDRLMLHERTHHHRGQRDRVLREVHDELGHRLVALQALARRAGADEAAALQAQLDDALLALRMAYESLDPAPRPLADALGQLHDQLLPALTRAGTRLAWTVEARAAVVVMTPAETLQVLRIVHEALAPLQDRPAPAPLQDRPALPARPGVDDAEAPGLAATVHLDVVDGETGRHLRLRIHDEPAAPPALPLRWQRVHAGTGASTRLQRQATMLGAQLSLEASGGAARHHRMELVIPLAGR